LEDIIEVHPLATDWCYLAFGNIDLQASCLPEGGQDAGDHFHISSGGVDEDGCIIGIQRDTQLCMPTAQLR